MARETETHAEFHNDLTPQGQLGICFPSLHQVPIDVTAGWAASPVDTRPPDPYLNSWVHTHQYSACWHTLDIAHTIELTAFIARPPITNRNINGWGEENPLDIVAFGASN